MEEEEGKNEGVHEGITIIGGAEDNSVLVDIHRLAVAIQVLPTQGVEALRSRSLSSSVGSSAERAISGNVVVLVTDGLRLLEDEVLGVGRLELELGVVMAEKSGGGSFSSHLHYPGTTRVRDHALRRGHPLHVLGLGDEDLIPGLGE